MRSSPESAHSPRYIVFSIDWVLIEIVLNSCKGMDVTGICHFYKLSLRGGVQRGGRGEVKFERRVLGEREARSLGSGKDRVSRSNLTSPPSPFVRGPRRLHVL